MEIFNLIANLEELINSSSKSLFSNKVAVDKDELSEILESIRLSLPSELKKAKQIKEERIAILKEAENEGKKIIKDAEHKVVELINDHEITRQALIQKEQILENANNISKEISGGTLEYANVTLERVENILNETINVIKTNRKELK